MKKFLIFFCILLVKPLFSEKIVFWHAFDGFLKGVFEEIVDDFNQKHEHTIMLEKVGNYSDVVQRGLEAYQEGSYPHIMQAYEVATYSLMQKSDQFFALQDLIAKFDLQISHDDFIDVVRDFYSKVDGKMMSLPWNASTGILFYNKEAFQKANLKKPPRTWEEMEEIAPLLSNAGYLGFTTAWPAAYHIEHFCSLHNLPFAIYPEKQNPQFLFNHKQIARHLTKLVEWQKEGMFSYSGRFNEDPEQKFCEGKCAILLQGANRLALLQKKASFEIGVGFLPYWSQISEPHNLNIGGASFWVFNGFKDQEYEAIAQFFSYLAHPDVQATWHQKTGYLPITKKAYFLTKESGFYENHPAAEIAVLSVMGQKSTTHVKGVRCEHYIEIRDQIVDALEKALNEEISSQEALDDAVNKAQSSIEP